MLNTASRNGTGMKRKLEICRNCNAFMEIEKPPTVMHGKALHNRRIVFKCWKGLSKAKVFKIQDKFTGFGHLVVYEADSEKEWGALEVPSCCEFCAEYCLEEWNKDEKKI